MSKEKKVTKKRKFNFFTNSIKSAKPSNSKKVFFRSNQHSKTSKHLVLIKPEADKNKNQNKNKKTDLLKQMCYMIDEKSWESLSDTEKLKHANYKYVCPLCFTALSTPDNHMGTIERHFKTCLFNHDNHQSITKR